MPGSRPSAPKLRRGSPALLLTVLAAGLTAAPLAAWFVKHMDA